MARDHRGREPGADVDFGFASAPGPDIASAAARTGQYVWVAARLFEIVGSWATTAQDPRHRAAFAGASSRFAWQAGEWRDRLPRLREVDHAALTRSPSGSATTTLTGLADLAATDRPPALRRLVTVLDGVYRDHAAAASPVRDGPILRSAARVRADLAALVDELGDI